MQAKTFLGKIKVVTGQYTNDATVLIVANSTAAAAVELDDTAKRFYRDESDDSDDGESCNEYGQYSANGGDILTEAKSVSEIGLSTFLELERHFMVVVATNVKKPTYEDLNESLKTLAQSVTKALNRDAKVISHSKVLQAMSAAIGNIDWQVHLAKTRIVSESTEAPTPSMTYAEALRAVAERGYQLRMTNRGNFSPAAWYLLLPGETEFKHVEDNHNYLGLFSNLGAIIDEVSEILGKEIIRPTLEEEQRFAADALFENAKFFSPVISSSGWTSNPSGWERAVFLEVEGYDSQKVTFIVEFTFRTGVVSRYGVEG